MALTTPNEDQKRVIETTEGPVLVIAGPGSGKTFCLVERVYNLLVNLRVKPENIMVSTFTEKASRELITRISNRVYEKKLKININNLCVGTLHSIFLHILEEFRDFTRLKKNYTIWDSFDQQYMIYKNISTFDKVDGNREISGNGNFWGRAGNIASFVNKMSEESLDPEKLITSGVSSAIALAKVYKVYENLLEENNALDFSKIQQELLCLLNEHPEVVKILQERFQYYMIDEYQDTNSIQERILFKILNKKNNICVVGDDDQSLYRFRGATVRNILEFPAHFGGKVKPIILTKNYRSHSGIISFYNDWMKQQDWDNKYRFDKVVIPGKDLSKEGKYTSVVKVSGKGEEGWCHEVETYLKNLKLKGVLTDWNQVVFLFNSVKNNKAKALANYLEHHGIPVYAPRSDMFFDREEIKLALGAICTLYHEYFKENDYNGNFKAYMAQCVKDFMNVLKKDKELTTFVRNRVIEHNLLINSKKNLNYALSGLFYQLLQFDLFAKYLGDESVDNVFDGRPARNLAKFSQLLTKFEYLENIVVFTSGNIQQEMKRFCADYMCFLYDGGIEEYEDETNVSPSGSVSFMTIHQSKGLEFPIVFVCSLWTTPTKQYSDLDVLLQQQFYHKPPFEPIEETKNYDFMRLYYTAYSRAQNLLCLSCPESDTGRKVPARMFVASYGLIPYWKDVPKNEIYNIKLDKIKNPNIKNEYSFTSHILLYENCPIQYKFYKDLDFAPVRRGQIAFGTLVHQTIEDVHKSVINGHPEKVTDENIEEWFHKNYENFKQAQHVYLTPQVLRRGVQQVIEYARHEKHNLKNIRESEVDVSFIEENYILKGRIDLIRNEHGKLDIVDFKSEKKPDVNATDDKAHLEQYKRQLEIYAHIVEGKYGEKVDKMHLYYTGAEDENPYITFQKNDLAIADTIGKVSQIVHKIERKDYSMKERNQELCNECDLRYYCNLHWGPKNRKN